jgi:hypothetical protein
MSSSTVSALVFRSAVECEYNSQFNTRFPFRPKSSKEIYATVALYACIAEIPASEVGRHTACLIVAFLSLFR